MPEISEQDFHALKDQVQALANQLNQARNRIEELEDFATDHIGLDWGATNVDFNSPHPNMSVSHRIHGDGSELTISTGAVTITTAYHRVDTQSDAASDDLDTVSGGTTGQILVLRAENDARSVVAKDGTGNLKLAGDCTLDNTEDTLTLIYNGTNWLELSRSDNGA